MKRQKHYYHLYVDDNHVSTILSGWPVLRVIRQLEKSYPDASQWEVLKHDPRTDESLFKLVGAAK